MSRIPFDEYIVMLFPNMNDIIEVWCDELKKALISHRQLLLYFISAE